MDIFVDKSFPLDTSNIKPRFKSIRSNWCTSSLRWVKAQYCIYSTLLLFPLRPNFSSSFQTLLKLNLSYNEVGDQGSQYIRNALRTNQVYISMILFLSNLSCADTD